MQTLLVYDLHSLELMMHECFRCLLLKGHCPNTVSPVAATEKTEAFECQHLLVVVPL